MESTMEYQYNGGRMDSIFVQDAAGKYVPQFSSQRAEAAFLQGAVALKPQGISGALTSTEDGSFCLWVRKQVRGKRSRVRGKPLPHWPCCNKHKFTQGSDVIRYYYEMIDPRTCHTNFKACYLSMYRLVQKHQKSLTSVLDQHDGFLTVEWLHASLPFIERPRLALHSDQVGMACMVPDTFNEVSHYLSHLCPANGLVFYYHGEAFKLNAKGFTDSPQNVLKLYVNYK